MRGKFIGQYDVQGINLSFYLPEQNTQYHSKGNTKRLRRAQKSIDSMLAAKRPLQIVVPEKILIPEELETLRKYFCKRAQADGVNYIYFDAPVTTTEKDFSMFD